MNDIFGQPIQAEQSRYRPQPQPQPQPYPQPDPCPGKKGTIIRIFIAPGTTISLFGLLEVTSPSGICLLVNIPLLAGGDEKFDLGGILDSLKKAGCKVEFVE